MALNRVREVVEQIKVLSVNEKIELLKILVKENLLPLKENHFTEEEIAEIEAALQQVARGEWVDFDEFRKEHDL